MKITKQTIAAAGFAALLFIAAAGFAALLFAPLAQAQTPGNSATRDIDIRVINSGMGIKATDISFGAFPTGNANQNLTLTCTADATGVVNSPVSDGATCGVITVSSSDDFNYKLAVSATPLTGRTGAAVGSSLTPTFNIFAADGTTDIAGLGDIDAETGADSRSTNAINLLAGNAQTYKMGGGILIGANQATGSYEGNYTVTAEVQETP